MSQTRFEELSTKLATICDQYHAGETIAALGRILSLQLAVVIDGNEGVGRRATEDFFKVLRMSLEKDVKMMQRTREERKTAN